MTTNFQIASNKGACTASHSARPRLSFLALLARLDDLRRSRRALGELETGQLEDIGISAEAATREAGRPAWDVPQSWLTRP